MQDFEIYGRTMKLGWGQKNEEGEVLNDGGPRCQKSALVRFDCIINKGCLFLHFLEQQAHYLMLLYLHIMSYY